MPLYRSARLFTLGLALAGTCAAQNTQDNKSTYRQLRQQQWKQQQRTEKPVRRAVNTKPLKKAEKANRDTSAA
jgi:hypothetical protein